MTASDSNMETNSIEIPWLIALKNPNSLQASVITFLALMGSEKSTTGTSLKMPELDLHVSKLAESVTTV